MTTPPPCSVWVTLLLFTLGATPAVAYDPPVERAGPLSVRIEGPDVVTETEKPLPVRVVMENEGDRAVEGTLRLAVIDRWRIEPAGEVPFSVAASGKASYEFRATAGEGTLSAHYPIHAFAKFELDGQEHVAHPILILETKLPPRPHPGPPIDWRPIEVAADGRLALWRLPVRRAVVQQFGQEAETTAVGWQGRHPENYGSLQVGAWTLDGRRREGINMHPPWHEGRVGTIAAEFPLKLPDCRPIKLRFAHAVTPEGHGDGVTFRVRACPLDARPCTLGEAVFARHSAAKTWQPAEADLSRYAGQPIRLRLESHPGPENNTGWDSSYWAEPMLVLGTPPEPIPMPPPDDAGSQLLGRLAADGSGRLAADGTSAPWDVRLWPGRRGLLDAVVGLVGAERRLYFRGFRVAVLGLRLDEPGSPVHLLEVNEEPCERGVKIRHRFESHRGRFDLVGRAWVEPGGLMVAFALENTPEPDPWEAFWIQDAAVDTWGEPVVQIYAGHGNVVCRPGPYRLGFDGHRLSTSFVGFDFEGGMSLVQATDLPPDSLEVDPAEKHYSLHVPHEATFTFLPAADVWQGVRTFRETNGLKPGGGVPKAAGRFVFDLWGGRYAESREALERSFRYGLTDAMVVWHNWQRWGYDYRLPEIYPANPRWGTHEEFVELCAACKRAGVLFALHDNYIDFYPDAEGFSYERQIAFHADGRPVKAWLNEGRGARSYRYRADAVEPFLRANLQRIRDGAGPTGYFIDVWSSIGPYDYWTHDGRFVDRVVTRDTWRRHFAWIRDFLGDDAPQISESGHDQLIGFLDGAQANHLRIGNQIPGHRYTWSAIDWPCADAERTPWFDAAYHDRFVLHGAGYESRYRAGLDPRLHGIYSDDYLATEVLTAHPAMVPRPFGRDVVRKYWLTGRLMRALALRMIERVEYADDDLHRQHVRWSGGAEVWVNRGEGDWDVAGVTLPQYGFLARVPTADGTVEASISRREGIIVETASSPEMLYVNGREPVDGPRRISLSVDEAALRDGRRVELPLTWKLDDPVPEGFRPFLHFVDAAGEIVFQGTQDPDAFAGGRTGAIAGKAVAFLPEGVDAGARFELRMGFYRPEGGGRLRLIGPDDGQQRIAVGTLCVEPPADGAPGVAFRARSREPDPLLARQNPEGKPVDFGPVVTAGACRLTPEGKALQITPLPSDGGPGPAVRIHWSKLPWPLPEPANVETLDESGNVTGRDPVRREGDAIVLECKPGVFAYRLVP